MKGALTLLLLLSLLACGESGGKFGKKKGDRELETPLFNLSCYYGDGEQNMSFPVWFDDSIIRSRGITGITRVVYDQQVSDSAEAEKVLPKKEYRYQFSKDGRLVQLLVKNFYDNKLISSVRVKFSKHNPTSGFALTTFDDQLDYDHKEFPFSQYEEVKSSKAWSCYQEANTMDLLYIIHKEEYWKPLTIDTLCYPDKDDQLILGSYNRPYKKYKVDNIVEERDVRMYSYENDVLTAIDWAEDPFSVRRTLAFDPKGVCTGFVDSTFSMGDYVSAVNYRFDLRKSLPVTVTRSLARDAGETVIWREEYSYTYK